MNRQTLREDAAMPTGTRRAEQLQATREALLDAAERLFAEHGLEVSARKVSEAAGQGNNTAVAYHFGSKEGLVKAVIQRHSAEVERRRQAAVERVGDSDDFRDWIGCLVRPMTDHLAALGNPTWYARFREQAATDPGFRELLSKDAREWAPLQRTVREIDRCMPHMPAEVRAERSLMMRLLLVHMPAERERQLAEGEPTASADWDGMATRLIDAIVGICVAPVSPESA
ncbi:TetR/AcrR family transcriptional regulator [Glycomyces sp. NPDC048151]|uniref:TetR/AcrR family transcriptional regulator n=1 Tax=Glycomyces sp. NPDC048151 TaxID=3364002 RepID=UPI0037136B36